MAPSQKPKRLAAPPDGKPSQGNLRAGGLGGAVYLAGEEGWETFSGSIPHPGTFRTGGAHDA